MSSEGLLGSFCPVDDEVFDRFFIISNFSVCLTGNFHCFFNVRLMYAWSNHCFSRIMMVFLVA